MKLCVLGLILHTRGEAGASDQDQQLPDYTHRFLLLTWRQELQNTSDTLSRHQSHRVSGCRLACLCALHAKQ